MLKKETDMLKKVSAAVLAAAVVMNLAGCGNIEESIIQNSSPAQSSASGDEIKPAVKTTDNSEIDASPLEQTNNSTPDNETIDKRNGTGGFESNLPSEDKDSRKFRDIAEKSVKIIAAIDRVNLNALVNVYLVDFTFDGTPEIVVSYDTGSGHSYVENDVYDLQSEDSDSIFSFRSSGITRDYAQSIFLYENSNRERFFAFNYGLDSGNYLKHDFTDKLEVTDNRYSVTNIFSSTIVTDPTLSDYSNEYIFGGNETDSVTYEQNKSDWFSDLRECQFCFVQVPIKAADWSDDNALMNRFSNAFADFEEQTETLSSNQG